MIIPQSKAELNVKISRLWVKHPRAERAFMAFDQLREGKRLSGGRGGSAGATLLAPTRSGKSRTVEQYIESRIVPECIERGLIPKQLTALEAFTVQRLVVHITLDGPTTVGGLMTDLLEALGDLRPTHGTVSARRHRVNKLLRANNTELLFFDEIQHLGREMSMAAQSRRETATSVQNSLKKFLLDGFPVCFVGLTEAKETIFSDAQIALRIDEEIDFSPLNYLEATDTEMVKEFCGRLSGKLFHERVFDHIVDLVSDDLPELFCAAAKGRLGLVAELVRWATSRAFDEGAHTLTRDHFAYAIDRHLLGKGGFEENPFAEEDGMETLAKEDLLGELA